MKSNIVIYSVLAVYFFVIATLYTVWHMIAYNGEVEWAGSLAVAGSGFLALFYVGYLTLNYRKQGGQLLEDQAEADIDDADPEIGEFSPWSWWPLLLAFGIAVVTLGLCINGYWLAFYGGPIALLGVVGLIFEYYRGNFAR
ncbi:cytochrome c oxidase subunit 4 [Canibacter zhoujuaniae]|uniref:aa3-type cytochrome oxidase subunit IV n=1 Tax=Canibacter zhoujuaniae TaxID=2708343 RepID=UPI00141F66AE|nr:cytochrome c oxidase subunit 4 [Canibacter zhoujuaniae]